ncbi:marginal zone B- and B1-cell-specific protein-like [Apostichopus japonicus]|uniref:marginal zone B- and B1-cell-specific protein-like n=1 Tax=Stichopus japonicus TaxID=307972 RepID=UPI003AB1CFAA
MKQPFVIALFCLFLTFMSIAVPTAVADEMSDEPVVDGEEETMEGEEFEGDEEDLTGMDVNGETIFFGIPEDDDEFHSMHIPQELKCDACKILAKQFKTAFDKANEKRPSLKKKLPESIIIDILEEECNSEFLSVGVKEIKGVKRLSGPGMPAENAVGVMQGGGKWPYRMKALCSDIVGEVEEDEIYGLYLEGKLETHLCLAKYKSCVTIMKDGRPRVEL